MCGSAGGGGEGLVGKRVGQIIGGMADVVGVSESWCVCVGREEVHGVKYPVVVGFGIGDGVASVVFHGGANIPSFGAVGTPGAAVVGFLMGDDFGAWWGHGGGIEIKLAMEECVGADFGMDSGGVE